MEAPAAEIAAPADTKVSPPDAPAKWTKPLVRLDAIWTKIETYLVLSVLIAAILYMSGWVTLNAFHTKSGKLARIPGIIATFAGLASLATWARDKDRVRKGLIAPGVILFAGLVLLMVAKKQEYFANVAHWLADASLIKQMGTPAIVSARLFTIWVALLGGSLATGAGRQINIDVVMRFIGPKPRLAVALLGYALTAIACFTISWGFLDYLSITRYGATKEAKASEKISTVFKAIGRHQFLVRKQLALDIRSFGKVVLAGKTYDKWYTGAEWNENLNDGWASVYPPPANAPPPPAGAPPYPTKPCLTTQESNDLTAKGGMMVPEWRLPSACDVGDGTGTRAPLATAPEPDDRTPLEADLSLLFPWGFFLIGLRFILRGALAAGGAVSTDPNAAHGSDGTVHDASGLLAEQPPIVEHKVDEEAKAHEGEAALPPDDANVHDALSAAAQKVDAKAVDIDAKAKGLPGEPAHHTVSDDVDPEKTRVAPPKEAEMDPEKTVMDPETTVVAPPKKSSRPPSMPPDGVPTAQRLEVAAKAAMEEEEERTLVGDLSELARAQELLEEAERKKKAEKAEKAGESTKGESPEGKKGGKK